MRDQSSVSDSCLSNSTRLLSAAAQSSLMLKARYIHYHHASIINHVKYGHIHHPTMFFLCD